ncbi:endolytic transglycosylase MltG, partial [Candidatus Gracilibacteria bacterium]|nr:endolytic transglycosylase MltG [Candidatus Gracilibacteria bacterium]
MFKLIKLIIWIAVISGGIFWWQYNSFKNTPVLRGETQITVNSGGFQKLLIDNGVNPLFARIYLSLHAPDFELQKGSYIVGQNLNITEFIESFKTPINQDDELLTILEGWNIYDIDRTLTQKELIAQGEFIRYVTDCEYFCNHKNTFAFISDAETLEGFLYPD